MRNIVLLLCIICVCCAIAPAGATVWTVGPSGADYTAIQLAINGAAVGDTILVYPDTYTENLVINKTLNLTAVINEDGYPRINGGSVGVAVLVTASAVNFSYFNVTNPTKYAIVIDSGSGRIANNTITSSGSGIAVRNSSGSNIVSGNAIENSGGMYVYNTTNSLLESNCGATMSVTLTNSTYIIVANNTIDGAKSGGALYYGLTLESSHSCTLYGNRVTNFHNYNLRLTGSHANRIMNNTILNGDQMGLYLYKSFDNFLDGNYVYNAWTGGISLALSKNSTLRNNRIYGCFVEFDVTGYYNEQDIDTSNVILYGSNVGPGSPIYYWIGKSHQEINAASNPGDVYLINCDHITLQDFNITRNGKGVYLNQTSYSTLTNVSAWNNEQGIYLENSSHNTIDGGWIKDNDGSGISLYNGNSYNVIKNVRGYDCIILYNSQFNTVEDNQISLISLDGSSNNLVQRNTVTGSLYDGLSITRTSASTPPANNNTLYLNTVSGCSRYALFLKNAYDNTINDTTISSSTYGLYLESSGRNHFDSNLFTGNTYHIAFTLPPTDIGTNRMNVTNTLDGKPVYWLVNRSDILFSNKTPVGALYGFNCTNITVQDQAITRNGDGAYFTDCSDITISNLTVNATYNGVSVIGTSGKNTITKSRITNITSSSGKGIYLKSSSGTTVSSTRFGTVKTALYLDNAENNHIIKNEISTEGKGTGIWLGFNSASNNTIMMNNITENQMGINSQGINTNTIWFNNFVNNKKYYAPVNTPVWNSTSPVGYTYNANSFTGFLGNYWSNYTGSDSTGTGVGDTPYSASGIVDLRPLVKPTAFYTLNSIPVPVANFTANRTSGLLPMVVQFTDLSTGSPDSWDWNFGDVGTGNTSTLQQPVHTYMKAGNYTVTLTATNAGGSNLLVKQNYITVSAPIPIISGVLYVSNSTGIIGQETVAGIYLNNSYNPKAGAITYKVYYDETLLQAKSVTVASGGISSTNLSSPFTIAYASASGYPNGNTWLANVTFQPRKNIDTNAPIGLALEILDDVALPPMDLIPSTRIQNGSITIAKVFTATLTATNVSGIGKNQTGTTDIYLNNSFNPKAGSATFKLYYNASIITAQSASIMSGGVVPTNLSSPITLAIATTTGIPNGNAWLANITFRSEQNAEMISDLGLILTTLDDISIPPQDLIDVTRIQNATFRTDGGVQVNVIDATGNPMISDRIALESGTGTISVTGVNNYRFNAVPAGMYQVNVTKAGYIGVNTTISYSAGMMRELTATMVSHAYQPTVILAESGVALSGMTRNPPEQLNAKRNETDQYNMTFSGGGVISIALEYPMRYQLNRHQMTSALPVGTEMRNGTFLWTTPSYTTTNATLIVTAAPVSGQTFVGLKFTGGKLGDVYYDTKVTSTDSLYDLHYVVTNLRSLSTYDYADVNRDGKITSTDALYILHFVVGNVNEYYQAV